ncbi:hypothetical protein EDB85DRAFT_1978776 [Lactarius pseudohatsudake]|nr:hypothetical protein EDB85DRAFT_1978776 [Lactarius pseudohatsudake]
MGAKFSLTHVILLTNSYSARERGMRERAGVQRAHQALRIKSWRQCPPQEIFSSRRAAANNTGIEQPVYLQVRRPTLIISLDSQRNCAFWCSTYIWVDPSLIIVLKSAQTSPPSHTLSTAHSSVVTCGATRPRIVPELWPCGRGALSLIRPPPRG